MDNHDCLAKGPSSTVSRRDLLGSALGLTVAGVAVTLVPRGGYASELPALSEDNPTAKALGYVIDASSLDTSVRGNDVNNCANCNFYPEPTLASAPCPLFPGHSVAQQGWCKGWVARP